MRQALASMVFVALLGGGDGFGQRLEELKPRDDGGGIVELAEEGDASGEDAAEPRGEVLCEKVIAIELEGDGEVPRRGKLRGKLNDRVGSPLDEAGLSELLDLVLGHYEENGRPVVDVWVPEQDMTGGRIVIGISAGRVGEVRLEEGAYFKREVLERRILVEAGEVVTQRLLDRQMANLGGSRFREVELFAAPGEEMGQTDLLYRIVDRRPWRLSAGYENSGTDVAGEDRWLMGFELGNAWGLDHRLSGQVTLGSPIGRYSGAAAVYEVPLDWGHRVVFEGAVADVDVPVDVLGLAVEVETRAWEVRVRYEMPLPGADGVEHFVSVGAEFGSASYAFSSGGQLLSEAGTESLHLVGRYDGNRRDGWGSWLWGGRVAWNPGGGSGLNTDAAYGVVRGGASSDGIYGIGRIQRQQRLPLGCVLLASAGAQWSSTRLLPEEMVTLGGAQRGRGYDEREFFGDEGYWGTVEVRTPGVGVFEGRAGGVDDDVVQGLGFFDWGEVAPLGGDGRSVRSAGIGLRYRLGTNVDFRFDYGWQIDGGGSRGHLGVMLSW